MLTYALVCCAYLLLVVVGFESSEILQEYEDKIAEFQDARKEAMDKVQAAKDSLWTSIRAKKQETRSLAEAGDTEKSTKAPAESFMQLNKLKLMPIVAASGSRTKQNFGSSFGEHHALEQRNHPFFEQGFDLGSGSHDDLSYLFPVRDHKGCAAPVANLHAAFVRYGCALAQCEASHLNPSPDAFKFTDGNDCFYFDDPVAWLKVLKRAAGGPAGEVTFDMGDGADCLAIDMITSPLLLPYKITINGGKGGNNIITENVNLHAINGQGGNDVIMTGAVNGPGYAKRVDGGDGSDTIVTFIVGTTANIESIKGGDCSDAVGVFASDSQVTIEEIDTGYGADDFFAGNAHANPLSLVVKRVSLGDGDDRAVIGGGKYVEFEAGDGNDNVMSFASQFLDVELGNGADSMSSYYDELFNIDLGNGADAFFAYYPLIRGHFVAGGGDDTVYLHFFFFESRQHQPLRNKMGMVINPVLDPADDLSVSIDLDDGHDLLHGYAVLFGSPGDSAFFDPQMKILGGAGNDEVRLQSGYSGFTLLFKGGAGDDSFKSDSVGFITGLLVHGDEGNDRMEYSGFSQVGGRLTFNGGDGDDSAYVQGVIWLPQPNQSGNVFEFFGGPGDDTARLQADFEFYNFYKYKLQWHGDEGRDSFAIVGAPDFTGSFTYGSYIDCGSEKKEGGENVEENDTFAYMTAFYPDQYSVFEHRPSLNPPFSIDNEFEHVHNCENLLSTIIFD